MKKKWISTAWRQVVVVPAVLTLLPLGGCARDLVFSTYTTLGVELKGAAGGIPTSVRFAYKRFEGAVVPVNPASDEPAHSVLASINAEQSLWSVRVNQVFATGEAADIAAQTERANAALKTPGPFASAVEAIRGGE